MSPQLQSAPLFASAHQPVADPPLAPRATSDLWRLDTTVQLVTRLAPELVVDLCGAAVERGSGVLVVQGGSASGALLRAALDERFPSTAPVATLHALADDADFLREIDRLSRAVEQFELVMVPADLAACDHGHDRFEALCARQPGVTLRCVVEEEALTAATVGAALAHGWVEAAGERISTSDGLDRLEVLELVLASAGATGHVHEIAARCRELGFPPRHVDRVVHRVEERQDHVQQEARREGQVSELVRQVGSLEGQVSVHQTAAEAVRIGNGDIVMTLRQVAAAAGHPILVEDEGARPLFWSDEPAPPPPTLRDVLGAARWRAEATKILPGTPTAVRLGAPAAGSRLLLRLGAKSILGYVSIIGCPIEIPTRLQHIIVELEAPVLVACRASQRTRFTSDLALAGVVRLFVADDASLAERLDAAELIGWQLSLPYRVLVVRAIEVGGLAWASRLVSLRRAARRAGFLMGISGDGLITFVTEHDQQIGAIEAWASRNQLVVGSSGVTTGPEGTPRAARQAAWAAQIASETGAALVRFDEIGFEALLFPDPEQDGSSALASLEALRESTSVLGFEPLETLRAVLAAAGNIPAAARALQLHANTVRYRLERIRAVAGLDVGDHETAFELEVALRVEAGRQRAALLNRPSCMNVQDRVADLSASP